MCETCHDDAVHEFVEKTLAEVSNQGLVTLTLAIHKELARRKLDKTQQIVPSAKCAVAPGVDGRIPVHVIKTSKNTEQREEALVKVGSTANLVWVPVNEVQVSDPKPLPAPLTTKAHVSGPTRIVCSLCTDEEGSPLSFPNGQAGDAHGRKFPGHVVYEVAP